MLWAKSGVSVGVSIEDMGEAINCNALVSLDVVTAKGGCAEAAVRWLMYGHGHGPNAPMRMRPEVEHGTQLSPTL